MLRGAVPSLPVRSVVAAVEHYASALGFACRHQEDGMAVLVRDETELHLWLAGDDGWRQRTEAELRGGPVCTGAETFLAGTASCRIRVTGIDALHAELAPHGVLHPTDPGAPTLTGWGTREVAVLDHDGNLLTFYEPV